MGRMQGIRASVIAALVLCSALVSCDAQSKGGRGGGHRGGGLGARVGEKIFNVLQFGAKPGGVRDSTQAISHAWVAACNSNGFARVVIPAGVFKATMLNFGGPCKTTSPIVFEISGTLKADSDISNYVNNGWISFERVDGLLVTGTGTIDGQGNNLWQYNDCSTNPSCVKLPPSLYLNGVKNAKIRGLHLVNSMGFHMHITNCYNLRINGLRITAPANSPNTDGMHISKSHIVKVAKTVIGTGDDCISLGQGSTNVTVTKVTCGPGHGISVGSLGKLPNELDVRGFRVKNCTLSNTENGLRIKTWPASGPSQASALYFSDIIMNNVKNPIIIDQQYGRKSTNKPSRVKIRNVVYQNIRGTTTSPVAVKLMCSKLVPCENVHFTNINLKFNGIVKGLLTSTCTNARAGFSGIQIPPPCK